ncbi:MAG: DUF962 domain-containing protein [Saprospiraceae bacterium]|nr:DUF962 domain-containing protein [Saprospiraceae bacterium]
MSKIDHLLEKYGESHQNSINKFIHWICVPSIMFSLFGLLYSIPFFSERTLYTNWATVLLVFALVYYLRLSLPMFLGFVLIGGAMVYGVNALYELTIGDAKMVALISFVIFAVSWVFQFVGHKIEGKKPSFLEDLQFLLVGPAWLLHFIYKKLGISY